MDRPQLFPNVNSGSLKPSLLWISCGTEDPLLASNRSFIAWLKERDVSLTAVETSGGHTWLEWRDRFIDFAQLLFPAGKA